MLGLLGACASAPQPGLAQRCTAGIESTANQLNATKAKDGDAKGDRARATSLVASARIDRAFDEYADCLEKVEQAQAYLRMNQS